jgi:hypothetical protein
VGCALSNFIIASALSPVQIEAVEKQLLELTQIDVPLVHRFAPGIYLREVTMPAGAFIIGHEHKTEHFNVVLKGKADVMMDGKIVDTIIGPCTFVSSAGVRKLLHIHEEMIWQTIHATLETDLAKLEEALIIKSESFKESLSGQKTFNLEDKE